MSESEPPTASSSPHEKVRLAIPLAMALIVGVFVALGIEGDVLARLIRNSPLSVGVTFVLAMLGVTLPFLLSRRTDPESQWPYIAAGVILLIASASAIVTGVRGLGEREQPDLDVVVVGVSEPGTVAVEFRATGLSLRSSDRMLLRVAALSADTPRDRVLSECANTAEVGNNAGATVLFWGEAGPDAKGSASTEITVEVPRGPYTYVCGYVILSDPNASGVDAQSVRRTTAILDLSSAHAVGTSD